MSNAPSKSLVGIFSTSSDVTLDTLPRLPLRLLAMPNALLDFFTAVWEEVACEDIDRQKSLSTG